jgi:hypothetical protein
MVSCRCLRNVKQQIDMLIYLRYLQDNWFYLGGLYSIEHKFNRDSIFAGKYAAVIDDYVVNSNIRE